METREISQCVSTSGGGIVSLKNIEELLKCPVCYDFMYSPIYQCQNGHTICSSCKLRVRNKCPCCRQQLGDIRCLSLEKIAETVELRCKYEEYGCLEINIPYCNKLKHEDFCDFRPYNCPRYIRGCSAVGDISTLVSHLSNHHKAKITHDSKFQTEFSIAHLPHHRTCTWMDVVSHCFDEYFCLHIEASSKKDVPIYMAFVYFMGNDRDACNYRYRLQIDVNVRKFLFEGIPHSLREDRLRIIEKGDAHALILNRSLWEEDPTTTLLYSTVHIWKKI